MAASANFQAFTVKSQGLARRLLTKVTVVQVYDPSNPPSTVPLGVQTTALWDTGASRSAIAPGLVAACGLTAVGTQMVNHAGGQTRRPTHLVNIELPNRVGVAGLLVTEFDAPPDFQVLIGMDIINLGDLAISNVNNNTWVSFRMPSIESVDFVAEHNRIVFGKVGRNDPCPCGKTKPNGERVKFKNCHLNLI